MSEFRLAPVIKIWIKPLFFGGLVRIPASLDFKNPDKTTDFERSYPDSEEILSEHELLRKSFFTSLHSLSLLSLTRGISRRGFHAGNPRRFFIS